MDPTFPPPRVSRNVTSRLGTRQLQNTTLATPRANQQGSPTAAATAAAGGLTIDRFQPGWPDQSRRRSPQKTKETTNTKKSPRLIMAIATKVACTPIESTMGLM